ncbi:protein of unknown function [Bartonella clarridgeiae 73]|uniref:Uncharacterized protein n=1 Tax=Bartonella clarridgeiae (strain CCUG 45776 / CIP 104772 / 73) TaxID=696125 RepID=E6YJ97_BARC7|nr:protein of unknown function [Bartonella clarridgeiae 73]
MTFETKSQLHKQLDFEQQGLQSDIARAKAGVEVAELNLAHTKIISPTVGYIGSVGVQVGQYVVPGMRLVTIIPDDIWIIAHYKETIRKHKFLICVLDSLLFFLLML